MNFLLTSIFLFNFFAFSQDKVSNNDLRHRNRIISVSSKAGELFEFSKNKLDQYYLQSSATKKINTFKIADIEFKKIDDLFVQDFINMKYMMSKKPERCQELYSLFMRGEVLSVCISEKDKIVKVQNLLSVIKKIK